VSQVGLDTGDAAMICGCTDFVVRDIGPSKYIIRTYGKSSAHELIILHIQCDNDNNVACGLC
jgi:hypothetical protein